MCSNVGPTVRGPVHVRQPRSAITFASLVVRVDRVLRLVCTCARELITDAARPHESSLCASLCAAMSVSSRPPSNRQLWSSRSVFRRCVDRYVCILRLRWYEWSPSSSEVAQLWTYCAASRRMTPLRSGRGATSRMMCTCDCALAQLTHSLDWDRRCATRMM